MEGPSGPEGPVGPSGAHNRFAVCTIGLQSAQAFSKHVCADFFPKARVRADPPEGYRHTHTVLPSPVLLPVITQA